MRFSYRFYFLGMILSLSTGLYTAHAQPIMLTGVYPKAASPGTTTSGVIRGLGFISALPFSLTLVDPETETPIPDGTISRSWIESSSQLHAKITIDEAARPRDIQICITRQEQNRCIPFAIAPSGDLGRFATLHSEYIELAQSHRASASQPHIPLQIDRMYAQSQFDSVMLKDRGNDSTGGEWLSWFIDIERVLYDVGVIRGSVKLRRIFAIERSREFDLIEYQNREASGSSSTAMDDEDGSLVFVRMAVSHSREFEAIDLVYHVMYRILYRVNLGEKGPFADVPVAVGDACYHASENTLGFVRGNMVVEISVTPGHWRDGRIAWTNPDKALREKIVEAAKRIDQLLQGKMFSAETRAKIAAAERLHREMEQSEP